MRRLFTRVSVRRNEFRIHLFGRRRSVISCRLSASTKPFSYHARDTKSSGEKIKRRATSKCRIAFKKRATTFHNSKERRIKISKIARGSAPDNSRPLSPSHEFKREILFEYLSHLPMFACVSADSNKDRYRDGLYTSPRFLSFLKCFIIIS